MTSRNRKILLGVAVLLIIISLGFLESRRAEQGGEEVNEVNLSAKDKKEKQVLYDSAKEFVNPSGFLNTKEFALADLIGKKVILLDIWTYSCINCQRTMPYLNQWYEKYADAGLEIVGLHTPEFEFEKERENVQAAIEKFGIKYPVVQDNDYGTWRAYNNRYWPRKYLIDIDGYVVYDHIGEGGYEETEQKIQELLAERNERIGESADIDSEITRPADAVTLDATKPRSPEVYFGATRNQYLSSGVPGQTGVQKFFADPEPVVNRLYLEGTWNIDREFAKNQTEEAKIVYRYQGRDVYMVAGSDQAVQASVYRDGVLVGEVVFEEETLYQLVSGDDYGTHTLEIIIHQPGLEVFTFTFG